MTDDFPTERTVLLQLVEIDLLLEALDAYEYWQLGHVLPRNNGEVFIPGDLPPGEDRYWDDVKEISPDHASAIDAVRECRGLSDRLTAIRFVPDPVATNPPAG